MDKLFKFIAMNDNPFTKMNDVLKTSNALRQSFGPSLASSFSNQFKQNEDFQFSKQFESIFKIYNQHKAHFPIMDNYFKGIEQNHFSIFSNWDKFVGLNNFDIIGRQIKNMEGILSGVTFQAAEFAIKREKWDLLEDFGQITNEVAEISERITDQQAITKNDLNEIKKLIQGIEIKIDQKDKDFFTLLLKWMTVIGFIMMLVSESRYLSTKDDALTKQDLEQFKIEISKTIDDKIINKENIHVINRTCNVRLKPGKRTLVIGTVEKGEELIILQTQGKWAYVRIKNNLTLNGWVFKKYIDR